MAEALLEVNNLEVTFATRMGVVSPVRGVSFRVNTHETLGIIGESGCGKSVTAQALMGLLSSRTSRVKGEVILGGRRCTPCRQKYVVNGVDERWR